MHQTSLEKIMTLKKIKKSDFFIFKSDFFYFFVQAGNTMGQARVDDAIMTRIRI